jgi:flagella basal body P-ring formation protein FlgA
MKPIASLIAGLSLLAVTWPVAAQQVSEARTVTVTLRSEAVVDDTIVTLDQIARLTGGTEALRKRLGKLDITDFPANATSRIVTGDLVRFRLLLAGLEASEFRLGGGSRTTIVEPDEPVSFRRLLLAAEQAVRSRYAGDAGSLVLTPSKGVVVPLVETHPADRVRFEPSIKGEVPRSGRVTIDIAIVVNGKRREVVPFGLDIAVQAASAKMSDPRESTVRPASNWMPSGGGGRPAQSATIKARDNVKIVVTLSGARLEATGEALEDGRVGQIIRVRNADSNRVVHGRVEASGIVVVEP